MLFVHDSPLPGRGQYTGLWDEGCSTEKLHCLKHFSSQMISFWFWNKLYNWPLNNIVKNRWLPQNLTTNSLLLTRSLADNKPLINTYFVYYILHSYNTVNERKENVKEIIRKRKHFQYCTYLLKKKLRVSGPTHFKCSSRVNSTPFVPLKYKGNQVFYTLFLAPIWKTHSNSILH